MTVTLAVADPVALPRTVDVLRAGGVVLLPTDTVYGIAVLPGVEASLAALKGRPAAMPIAVLVADADQAEVVAGLALPAVARRLAARHWPGPLTIVVPTTTGATLGVRQPDHDFVRALTGLVGPIATTSANRHGEPTPSTAAAAAAALAPPGPTLVIDGGRCGAVASTVVDATGPTPVILREGALSAAQVLAF